MTSGFHLASSAPPDVEALARTVHGPAAAPNDPHYEAVCAGLPLHPAVVVDATSARDVQLAVEFAGSCGLQVVVRRSGDAMPLIHEDMLVITTDRLQGLNVDVRRRTARIEPAVRWDAVIDTARAFGVTPVHGSAGANAMSDIVGGGIGPLARTFGLACDRVRSLEVVTADAALRTVDSTRHPDLFWALRSGENTTGVITSAELDLLEMPRVYGGSLFFDGRHTAEVLHAFAGWSRDLPESMNSSLSVRRWPDMASIPRQLRGNAITEVRVAYLGEPEEGRAWLRPLRTIGERVLDTVTDTCDPACDSTAAGALTTTYLHTLDAEVVDLLLDYLGPSVECPLTAVEIRRLGGAVARQPEPPNAARHRNAAYSLHTVAPQDSVDAEVYGDELIDRLKPWSEDDGRAADPIATCIRPDGLDETSADYRPPDSTKARVNPS
jgi:FAD/FMN-containing dehydrogenase